MHGLGVLHHGVRRQVHVDGVLEDRADHSLEHRPDLVFGQEAGLDIDLCELGLAIGAQILVTEALGDLVVPIEAGHHEQLLEELRTLRQCEEHALVDAARHEVVASTLGRALGEHGRLDVDEPMSVQEITHLHRDAIPQDQVALHGRPTQIEHPVSQPGGLRQVLVVDLERWSDARVEHLDLEAQHLDASTGQVGVLGPGRSRADLAHDLEAELIAHALRRREHLGAVGVAHHLHQSLAVAKVDEDDPTVVAPAMRPAHQCHGLTQQGLADQAAIRCSHVFTPDAILWWVQIRASDALRATFTASG